MKNKSKLLLVSAVAPYPQDSGGAVRAYHTLKELSKYFEIYYVYFTSFGNPPNSSTITNINKYAKESFHCEMFHKKTHTNFFDFGLPYWFSDWYSPEAEKLIPLLIRKYQIQVAHVDFCQIAYLLDYIPKQVYTILGAIDITTISFWRRLFENRNPIRFVDHFFKFLQVYVFEKKYILKPNLITAMSDEDKMQLQKLFHITGSQIEVVRNGIKIDIIKKLQTENKGKKQPINLGFIGSFSHPPNRKAVEYLFSVIVPKLKKQKIPFKLFLAGNKNPDEINQLLLQNELTRNKNIFNLGFVPDINTFYKKIDVLIAPIFSGSGTRIKILESLGKGVPVISTTIGAEGIAINSPYLNVTNDPDQMLNIVKNIYQKKLFNSKDINILIDKMQKYSWDFVFKSYAHFLNTVL